jgi:hypothetical protein
MFCAPGLFFDGSEGVRSHFHVLIARTRFRWYRGRRVPFSYFARQTRYRRYRGCRVMFSCFACWDSFSTVPRASGPVFMFCAPGHIFGGAEGVCSSFHVLRSRTRFQRCGGVGSYFHVLRSRTRFRRCGGRHYHFYVLRAQTLFQQYRRRKVSFSCFELPDMFLAVRRASGPFLMFCAPGLIFGGSEGVGSRFHVLSSRTCFWRCGGRRVPF